MKECVWVWEYLGWQGLFGEPGSRRFAGQTEKAYSLCCAGLHDGWSQTVQMLGRAEEKQKMQCILDSFDFIYIQLKHGVKEDKDILQ